MFNRLFGTVGGKTEQTLYLKQGGIEWEILTSSSSLSKIPAIGAETEIFAFLYHREDQLTLYGFATDEERKLFLELIRVPGIGPKQACKILSNISDALLIEALNSEDVDALAGLPGLGKKTAQKMILALRGKLSKGEGAAESPYSDIIEALGNMGFDRSEAKRIVAEIAKRPELKDLAEAEAEKIIMKEAIIGLSK